MNVFFASLHFMVLVVLFIVPFVRESCESRLYVNEEARSIYKPVHYLSLVQVSMFIAHLGFAIAKDRFATSITDHGHFVWINTPIALSLAVASLLFAGMIGITDFLTQIMLSLMVAVSPFLLGIYYSEAASRNKPSYGDIAFSCIPFAFWSAITIAKTAEPDNFVQSLAVHEKAVVGLVMAGIMLLVSGCIINATLFHGAYSYNTMTYIKTTFILTFGCLSLITMTFMGGWIARADLGECEILMPVS